MKALRPKKLKFQRGVTPLYLPKLCCIVYSFNLCIILLVCEVLKETLSGIEAQKLKQWVKLHIQ